MPVIVHLIVMTGKQPSARCKSVDIARAIAASPTLIVHMPTLLYFSSRSCWALDAAVGLPPVKVSRHSLTIKHWTHEPIPLHSLVPRVKVCLQIGFLDAIRPLAHMVLIP
jgi:hypothetical protein